MSPVEQPVVAAVVMGVAGVGKTTVGEGVAQRLGWRFLEGDSLHGEANIAKMSAGIALTDEDRWPWLDRIADVVEEWRRDGTPGIVTCSALKQSYRDRIRAGHDDVLFAHLDGPKELIAERMGLRTGHFMPTHLLDSQFATLEPPAGEPGVVTVDVALPVETLVDAIADYIMAKT